jgi:hypothetical protein
MENNTEKDVFDDTLDNILCDDCLEKNLTEDVRIQRCVTCKDEFCMHHVSNIDPGQCEQCCSDVIVEISTIRKVIIDSKHRDIRSRKARQIKLGGLHWLFAQRKIKDMSDDDTLRAIEYHHAIYNLLLHERETRRNEAFHRNANKTFKVPQNHTTTTKTVKKVKTVKTPIVPDLTTIIAQLKKAGFSDEQIMNMAMGKK